MAKRIVTDEDQVRARIVAAGDLQFQVFDEGRWRRQDYPRAMLIQFATDDDVCRAFERGVVAVSFDRTEAPPPHKETRGAKTTARSIFEFKSRIDERRGLLVSSEDGSYWVVWTGENTIRECREDGTVLRGGRRARFAPECFSADGKPSGPQYPVIIHERKATGESPP